MTLGDIIRAPDETPTRIPVEMYALVQKAFSVEMYIQYNSNFERGSLWPGHFVFLSNQNTNDTLDFPQALVYVSEALTGS